MAQSFQLSSTKLSDFEIQARIGQGSFGVVYKAVRKSTKAVYAIKAVSLAKMTTEEVRHALTEVRILCSVQSRFLVSYKEAFLNGRGSELYIVMEFVGGGDLASKIGECAKRRLQISEDVIWAYLVQCLTGLRTLHRLRVIHRDIKSANLLLSDDFETIKIGDLNIAKVTKNDFAQTQIGTPAYLAPEIWKGEAYTSKCDIFSLGCVIYEMAALREPFDAPNFDLKKNRVCGGVVARLPCIYSEELNQVVRLCMTTDPQARPSADQLLSHPVILARMRLTKIDFEEEEMQRTRVMPTIRFRKSNGGIRADLPRERLYRGKSADLYSLSRYIASKCNVLHEGKEDPFMQGLENTIHLATGEAIKRATEENAEKNSKKAAENSKFAPNGSANPATSRPSSRRPPLQDESTKKVKYANFEFDLKPPPAIRKKNAPGFGRKSGPRAQSSRKENTAR